MTERIERGRYPTHEEIQVILERARHMRSEYMAALFSSAWQRVKLLLSGDRAKRAGAASIRHADAH